MQMVHKIIHTMRTYSTYPPREPPCPEDHDRLKKENQYLTLFLCILQQA